MLACRTHGGQAAAQTAHLQVPPGCCSCACCRPTCCSPRRLPSLPSMLPYCACVPPPSKAHLLLQVTPHIHSCTDFTAQVLARHVQSTISLFPDKMALSKSIQFHVSSQSSLWACLQQLEPSSFLAPVLTASWLIYFPVATHMSHSALMQVPE